MRRVLTPEQRREIAIRLEKEKLEKQAQDEKDMAVGCRFLGKIMLLVGIGFVAVVTLGVLLSEGGQGLQRLIFSIGPFELLFFLLFVSLIVTLFIAILFLAAGGGKGREREDAVSPASRPQQQVKREARKTMSEREAADFFIVTLIESATEVWPQVAESLLKVTDKREAEKMHTFKAEFEFAMACLAEECQALPSLFPPEQAKRIRRHVEDLLSSLSCPEVECQAIDCFRAYSKAWEDGLTTAPLLFPMFPPGSGVAVEFCLRTGSQVRHAKNHAPNIVFISVVGSMIAACSGSFWKDFSEEYRLSEST